MRRRRRDGPTFFQDDEPPVAAVVQRPRKARRKQPELTFLPLKEPVAQRVPRAVLNTEKRKRRKRAPKGALLKFLVEVALPFEDKDACLYWPYSTSSGGYGQIDYDGGKWRVTRLICWWVYGAPPTPKHQAAHSCGRGHLGCVNKHHLRWATPLENSEDQRLHGTLPAGSRHPSAKLIEADIPIIRDRRYSKKQMAERFGISTATVDHVRNGYLWAHIPFTKEEQMLLGLCKKFGTRGSRNYRTKLKETDIPLIMDRKYSRQDLAQHFGISASTVGKIRGGHRWKHVPR